MAQADEERENAEEQRIIAEAEAIVRSRKAKLEKMRAAASAEMGGGGQGHDAEEL